MVWNQQTQIILVAFVGLLSISYETSLAATPVQVFLLGGQSNMDGRASQSGLPAALQNPQADVLLYTRAGTPGIGGTLASLQPGSFRTDGFGNFFGPEVTFGRSLADALPSVDFALIKHAVGGTSLAEDWNPNTGSTYAAFKSTVADGLAALASAGHPTEIAGMLWLQGERDAVVSDAFANAYEANLTEFIGDVRNEYGADLPFLIGQLSSNLTAVNSVRLATVRQAQENVDNALANTALIVSESFSIKSDNLHYDAAGQIAFGEAFAAAALPFVIPEPSSLVLMVLGSLFFTRRVVLRHGNQCQ